MSEKTKEIVHHIEWFSVIATLIGGYFLMNSLFNNLDAKIERQSQRTDCLYQMVHETMQKQTERTDKLYEMFIEIVKENKESK